MQVDRCLLILDLIVPTGVGGKEALRQSREIAPGIKAIIASGYADDETLVELTDDGITEVLTKPYDMRELLSTVAEMVETG